MAICGGTGCPERLQIVATCSSSTKYNKGSQIGCGKTPSIVQENTRHKAKRITCDIV